MITVARAFIVTLAVIILMALLFVVAHNIYEERTSLKYGDYEHICSVMNQDRGLASYSEGMHHCMEQYGLQWP
jgi:archaellum component FlaF (FlaF/FlaG flagellin family)